MTDPRRMTQTNIRRWIASIEQTRRLFGYHREADADPEEPPKQLPDAGLDENLDVELDELEAGMGET